VRLPGLHTRALDRHSQSIVIWVRKKPIPAFSDEDEERRFWAEHDAMLEDLKMLANKQDVPYQSLMKVYLAERIGRERTKKAS
jgi:hypothetical protein